MADNNFSVQLSSNHINGKNIDNGSYYIENGYVELHTVNPDFGISAVNITALSVSSNNSDLTFIISGLSALPFTLYWNGSGTAYLLPPVTTSYFITCTNNTKYDYDVTSGYKIAATMAGILSSGAIGTLSDGTTYSNVYTVYVQGDVPGFTTPERHRILYNEESEF